MDVLKIDATQQAEKAGLEEFLSTLQQLTTDFQKRTSSFIQLAADLHIRSDARLSDLSESLATEFGTKSQPEVGASEHATAACSLEIRMDDESQNKG